MYTYNLMLVISELISFSLGRFRKIIGKIMILTPDWPVGSNRPIRRDHFWKLVALIWWLIRICCCLELKVTKYWVTKSLFLFLFIENEIEWAFGQSFKSKIVLCDEGKKVILFNFFARVCPT